MEERKKRNRVKKIKYQNLSKIKIQRTNDLWLRDEIVNEVRIV